MHGCGDLQVQSSSAIYPNNNLFFSSNDESYQDYHYLPNAGMAKPVLCFSSMASTDDPESVVFVRQVTKPINLEYLDFQLLRYENKIAKFMMLVAESAPLRITVCWDVIYEYQIF